MNQQSATHRSQDSSNRQSDLQSQYGRIAISAVAAALPYGGVKESRREEPRKTHNATAEARD